LWVHIKMPMKKLITLFLILIPLFGISQAMLGSTEQEIRQNYSDRTFTSGLTTDTYDRYISTDFQYGNMTYYFNDSTHLCRLCMQIPNDISAVNSLVQLYNGKYVIITKTSWDAYLPEGTIMHIILRFAPDSKIYLFYYQY
jgi:hypothetical protein